MLSFSLPSLALVLFHASAVISQSTTTSSEPSSCTASLITTLCDYPAPGPEFAIAASGRSDCYEYCNSHQPCNFFIFAVGNPHTGSGTCWLYPGTTFDASAGKKDGCASPWLSVYDKPVCAGTPTESGSCTATASPSAVASVCGYPSPPDNCFSTCSASLSAGDCLSQCAKADSCSYVVFNPHNPSMSPYAPGSCWMYPNGTYDAKLPTGCSGAPEQYVYNNVCPKPARPSSSSSSSLLSSLSSTSPSATVGSSSQTAGSTSTTCTKAGVTSGAIALLAGNNGALASTTVSGNSAPTGLSFVQPIAMGLALMVLQGF